MHDSRGLIGFVGRMVVLVGAGVVAEAGGVPFARDVAVSPDGAVLAFSWAGDVWVVASGGGAATRLTVHPADDGNPVWSHDGQWLAFSSDRHGAANVLVMRRDGTDVKRLTFGDVAEIPTDWAPDDREVYFQSRREGDAYREPRLYQVPVAGGQAVRLVDCFGAAARVSPDGKTIAFTRGSCEWWRRGYRGSGNHDVWLWTVGTEEFTQLTDFDGVDRSPMWGADGRGVYYLSERGGTVNVWYQQVAGGLAEPVTLMSGADVRDFSVSADGQTLAFTHWDEIYVLNPADKRARALAIRTAEDAAQNQTTLQMLTSNASEAAVSPDEKEIALVVQGDLFVIQTEENRATRHVLASPAREREVTWAPDGKALYFVSDREGQEDIYRASSGEEPAKALSDSLSFKIERVTDDPAIEEGPQVSPDGKALAFVRGRGDLVIRDLKTGKETPLVAGWSRPEYRWSPDSQWLAYQAEDNEDNADIWIVTADGRQPAVNISQHPDNDVNPQWSADGQMLTFASRRDGFDWDLYAVFLSPALDEKSASGFDEYFQKQAEEVKKRKPLKAAVASGKIALGSVAATSAPAAQAASVPATQGVASQPSTAPAKQAGAKTPRAALRTWLKGLLEEEPAKKKEEEKKPEKAEKYAYELESCYKRIRRVTSLPGDQAEYALAPDGALLAFKSSHDGEARLYTIKWNGEELKQASAANVTGLQWGLDGKRLYHLKAGVPGSTTATGGDSKAYKFRAKLAVDHVALAAQKFDDAARRIELVFYHPTMKGLDWPALTAQYRALALRTRTLQEFNEVFNMLLGELNASHLGIYGPDRGGKEQVGHLGCMFDRTYAGPGLRVQSVVPRAPAARAESRLVPGDILIRVNNEVVGPDAAIERALTETVGEEVLVEFIPSPDRKPEEPEPSTKKAPTSAASPVNAESPNESTAASGATGGEREEPLAAAAPVSTPPVESQPAGPRPRKLVIRPIASGALANLRYDAWVNENRAYVEAQSGGRVGYLHIRGMDENSFQIFQRDLYAAAHGKDGLIIDVRNNGGGWTADWVLAVLNVKRHAYTVSRGGQPGYPHDRLIFYAWTKPATMMCNQHSFSNAEIIAHAFKTLQRGPLVGTTTFGGVISTGAYNLMDGALVRTPGRGWYMLPGGVDMESHGAEPDVQVAERPADEVHGARPQLDAAIRVTLEQVERQAAQP